VLPEREAISIVSLSTLIQKLLVGNALAFVSCMVVSLVPMACPS